MGSGDGIGERDQPVRDQGFDEPASSQGSQHAKGVKELGDKLPSYQGS
jgi:hypothetical protein